MARKPIMNEQETQIVWLRGDTSAKIYTSDTIVQRRMEVIGAVLVRSHEDGTNEYELPLKQITLRKPQHKLSKRDYAIAVANLAKAKMAKKHDDSL